MSDLQKIKDLIDSDEESNWILAVELARLLDNESQLIIYEELHKLDLRLHIEKWNYYFESTGIIYYNPIPNNVTPLSPTVVKELITNFKNIMNGKNNNT